MPGLHCVKAEAGWDCFQRRGTSLPEETLNSIRGCRAALFGAVSSPSYKVAGYRSAIVGMRQRLDLYANIRPVRSLMGISPKDGVDLIVVRENTEGLYIGREQMADTDTAVAERVINPAGFPADCGTGTGVDVQRGAKEAGDHPQGQYPAR